MKAEAGEFKTYCYPAESINFEYESFICPLLYYKGGYIQILYNILYI